MVADLSEYENDTVRKYRRKKKSVIVTHSIFIPKGLMPQSVAKKRYYKEIYLDDKCNKCENKPDRHPDNDMCSPCPAFVGLYKLYTNPEFDDQVDPDYWVVPQGDEIPLRRWLAKNAPKHKWLDLRSIHKMQHRIKFTGKLFTGKETLNGSATVNQKKAYKEWKEKGKVGVIVAPPRAGKTAIATYAYCDLGVRTVVIAHSRDLLNQFYETATGETSPTYKAKATDESTAGRHALTNIRDVEEEVDMPLIYMPKSYKDLQKFVKKWKRFPQVLLIPYQSFIRDLSRVRKVINKRYSFSIIDESHRQGADAYFDFSRTISVKYRLNLSATPQRKDGSGQAYSILTGPILSTVYAKMLPPQIVVQRFKTKPKSPITSWQGMLRFIECSKERAQEMVDIAFGDMAAGHSVIIIPVDRKKHIAQLVDFFNKEAQRRRKLGEKWPKKLARPYFNGVPRQKTLAWVDSIEDKPVGKKIKANNPKVLVVMRSMFTEGIDVKRPSCMLVNMPMSANRQYGCPGFRQLSYRVCTPFKDKPQPLVRILVDNISASMGCATSLLFQEIYTNSTLSNNERPSYKLEPVDYTMAKEAVSKATPKSSRAESGSDSWWKQ